MGMRRRVIVRRCMMTIDVTSEITSKVKLRLTWVGVKQVNRYIKSFGPKFTIEVKWCWIEFYRKKSHQIINSRRHSQLSAPAWKLNFRLRISCPYFTKSTVTYTVKFKGGFVYLYSSLRCLIFHYIENWRHTTPCSFDSVKLRVRLGYVW